MSDMSRMRLKMWMGAQDMKKTKLTRSSILFIFFILASFLDIPLLDIPEDDVEEIEYDTLR
jgi:hypothetical protein